jgi:hypothetical protein
MMRMRGQPALGEVDAPAIEQLAARRDGDEDRRIAVLGDADGCDSLRVVCRHVCLLVVRSIILYDTSSENTNGAADMNVAPRHVFRTDVS